jgi:hypothetical protein
VHRFDPEAQSGGETLAKEYRAYYWQMTLTDELYLRHDELGAEVRRAVGQNAHFLTKDSLMNNVAKLYKFDPNPNVCKNYKELPVARRWMPTVKPSPDPRAPQYQVP